MKEIPRYIDKIVKKDSHFPRYSKSENKERC